MFIRLNPGKSRAPLAQVFLVTSALLLTGCASTEKLAENSVGPVSAQAGPVDPYEGFNRSMYKFNMGLDKYFFKPVADGYKFITPDFVETGVSNFFNNLKGINVVLNDVLQGKFHQGASDAGRFLANTTIGVAGLVDVASKLGLEHNVEDFGQTLAVWGVDEGPYLVLPVIGPTTIRDGGGLIVDKAANPGTYVPFTGVIEGISDRANAQGALNFIDEAALDPYVFTRESFLQYRRHLIADGQSDSRNDLELDIASEADHDIDDSNAIEPTAETTRTIDEAIQPPIESADSATGRSSAFDDVVQSFEQASLKIDQLSKNPRLKLTRLAQSESSIQ
ncbi:MAG: MlaA family lipoprotein [Gammaproteobacteria bacterium]